MQRRCMLTPVSIIFRCRRVPRLGQRHPLEPIHGEVAEGKRPEGAPSLTY